MPAPSPPSAALERALEFLRTKTNYEQADRSGAPFGLEPMRRLLERLGHPEERLKVVHVAGTKGKGSVTWFVDALLRRMGVTSGRYLSPHLQRIEERIAIGGRTLSPDEFGEAVLAVAPHAEGSGATFFDLLTAAAVRAFAEARLEFAAIETGLGGRLDSTNALPKVAAAVTAIGLEHVEVLGRDTATIAREKAYIARRGVPLFSASPELSPEGRAIAAVAREQGAPLFVLGREFQARNVRTAGAGLLVDVETVRRTYLDVRLPTIARYQVPNAALAVAILDDLEARRVIPDRVREAVERPADERASDLAVPGRFEVVPARGGAAVVLDGAHTAESLAALLDSLDAALPARPRVVVLGISADKDPDRLSSALRGRVDTVLATRAASPRAAEPQAVVAAALRAGLHARVTQGVAQAVEEAEREASPSGVVVVTGSLYLVGEARSLLVR